jgi:hypothetical protein
MYKCKCTYKGSKGLQSVNYSFSAGLWLFLLCAQFYMGANRDILCKTWYPLQNQKYTITGVSTKWNCSYYWEGFKILMWWCLNILKKMLHYVCKLYITFWNDFSVLQIQREPASDSCPWLFLQAFFLLWLLYSMMGIKPWLSTP